MAKKKQPYYDWDEKIGLATCILYDKDNAFIGLAQCHDDDKEFQSKYTGMIIAETRAKIKVLQHIKNNELKPELASLKQLYYSMNKSKLYNKKSYEAKMLWRQMQRRERDINIIKDLINQERSFLNNFIADKDKFYKTVQKNRDKNN